MKEFCINILYFACLLYILKHFKSEEAFELARKGTPRAQLPGVQIVYNIELDSFKPPYFALHVQIVGETDMFLRYFLFILFKIIEKWCLRDFIHEIGLSLGTTASCVRLQRLFTCLFM